MVGQRGAEDRLAAQLVAGEGDGPGHQPAEDPRFAVRRQDDALGHLGQAPVRRREGKREVTGKVPLGVTGDEGNLCARGHGMGETAGIVDHRVEVVAAVDRLEGFRHVGRVGGLKAPDLIATGFARRPWTQHRGAGS